VAGFVCQALCGGAAAVHGVQCDAFGKAVQVDLVKPTLKAPGTKRLKQKYDNLLSSFAFNFNSRRYNSARGVLTCYGIKVGWCRLTVSKPVLKACLV